MGGKTTGRCRLLALRFAVGVINYLTVCIPPRNERVEVFDDFLCAPEYL